MAKHLNFPKDADWYACPSCGTEVRVGTRGCPKCTPGAGGKWKQEKYLDGVDVPDDPEDFDYNDFVKREFGTRPSRLKPHGIKWKWWITGVVLVLLMIWGVVNAVW